jgi:SulP family sulfate permease
MVTGAIQVVTDQKPTLGNLGAFTDHVAVQKIAAGVVVAILLHIFLRRFKSPFALPGVLLAAFIAAYIVMIANGSTLAAAQGADWMFNPQPAAGLTLPWHTAALHNFPWASLPSLAGDALAVMFVTISTLLLNTTGIEIATRTEAHIERDLKVLGIANLLTAAFGGYVSCTSFSRSILVRTAGATSRLAALTVAAVSAAALIADPSFLGYVPKFVLAGLLFYLGSDLVYQWLLHSSRRLLPLEYLSLIAIAALIIYSGFVAGVLIGIVIGCATFALSASRVNAIKFTFDGSEFRSSLDRGPRELFLLAEHGHQIQGIALQSYLFFGSANRLYQYVKVLLARLPDCQFIIFDFRLVTGIDSSATHSFAQIKQAMGTRGASIVLVNLSPELERAFRTARFIANDVTVASDLDHALEECEQTVIEKNLSEGAAEPSLRAWLTDALGNAEYADQLTRACRRLDVNAGDVIAWQGEPASSMHFILEGRVGIIVDVGEGRTMRVRSLGRHTTIGEMGLITQKPRSATIQAEAPSVLYELTADAYEKIKAQQPALSQALLGYVVAIMAERLSFANRVVGVLQR